MGLQDTVLHWLSYYWEKNGEDGASHKVTLEINWCELTDYQVHQCYRIKTHVDSMGRKKNKSSLLKTPWDIVLSVYLTMLGLYDFNTMVTGLERWVNGYKNACHTSVTICAEIPRAQNVAEYKCNASTPLVKLWGERKITQKSMGSACHKYMAMQ